MAQRWYKDGLRFECTQCGRCCTGAPGYVWVTRAEVAELAKFLNVTLEKFAQRFVRKVGRRYSLIEKANNDCVFYDGGCTVYPVRPRQCRTYPFWPENLKSRHAWDELEDECPGVGQGKLYPLEEIQIIVRDGEPTS